MPQLVICHKCGAVLYEGEELKAPSDIIESYDGKCPTCGKKLSYIPIDFEVKPVEETKQLSPLEPEKRVGKNQETLKKKECQATNRNRGAYGRACRMDFCPNCGKRLTLLKKREGRKVAILLSCPKCGYEKRATRPITPVPKILEHSSQVRIAVIGKEEQKLRTLPTVNIECPRCGNNLAYAWIVQIRRLEESSTQFFRCTRCNYTFRENS